MFQRYAARPSAGLKCVISFIRLKLLKASNFTKTKKPPALGLAVFVVSSYFSTFQIPLMKVCHYITLESQKYKLIPTAEQEKQKE